jgi:hypothetical protein
LTPITPQAAANAALTSPRETIAARIRREVEQYERTLTLERQRPSSENYDNWASQDRGDPTMRLLVVSVERDKSLNRYKSAYRHTLPIVPSVLPLNATPSPPGSVNHLSKRVPRSSVGTVEITVPAPVRLSF